MADGRADSATTAAPLSVAVCFSGGTDSALAALFLEPHADVTLVTGTVGASDGVDHAAAAATALGLPHERVALDEAVAAEAVERMVADGYPRHGIQQVHEHALETVADRDRGVDLDVDAVADGTRRDDRVPRVDRSQAQSLEDRHGVAHLAPLAGIGREAIDAFAAAHLKTTRGPSEELGTGDYEADLRAIMCREHGQATVDEVFPDHVQSRVTGRADGA
jgi:predicted subunit of tRNA(5-methylaminomethyl-2-thiouridylate) methyltransferase